jgi:integrase
MRGHIRKRGKASWAVVIEVGRDPQTGKRRQKWFAHKTRREAEAHLAQIVAAMQGGGWTPPAKVRLGDFLDQWLRDYAAGAVGPVTLRNYADIIRVHLKPALGHLPLSVLSAQAVQSYMSRKLADGLAPVTVKTHHRVLSQALRCAVKWGLLVRNPAALASPPRQRQHEVRVWDEEQTRLFLGEAKRSSRLYPLYLAAITTGMRAGELLGLRWRDVDLVAGVASVQQTFYRLGGQKLFKAPKTAAARRAIALPGVLVEELRALREEQAEHRRLLGPAYADHDLVFCQPNGRPLHLHNLVRRDFRSLIERAGLPRIRFHDLRHLHASHGARAGVPVKVMQERLGHATPHFTMQVYTHTLAGMQAEAARAIETRLFGAAGLQMFADSGHEARGRNRDVG